VSELTADFLGNEQEHMRRSNNSVIDERTMHEIYLEPFRHQMKANPKAFVRLQTWGQAEY
jgi:beta-glucosidase